MVRIAWPVLYLRVPSPPAVCCMSAGASPRVTRGARPRTSRPPPCPLPPAPAPLTAPFLRSASGPSHGYPPTIHPPPGAPVGDPTAALHLPPSSTAPLGDPTAAIHPPPPQAALVGDPTAALLPPLSLCSAGGRSHGCTPSPSLPLQRRWAIPRLHSPPPPHNLPHYTAGRVAERSTPRAAQWQSRVPIPPFPSCPQHKKYSIRSRTTRSCICLLVLPTYLPVQ